MILHRRSIRLTDGPFDLDRIAGSGQMFRWRNTAPGWLLENGSDVVWFRSAPLAGSQLELETNLELPALRRFLRLDLPYSELRRELLRLGPELGPGMAASRGLRMLRSNSKVETLFAFLCSANNHVPRICSLVRKLAEFGSPLGDVAGHTVYAFPGIETIAAIDPAALRALGFGYRSETIVHVATELSRRGGEGYLRAIADQGYEATRQALMGIKGIGPKLADCICLFGFDFTEAVPIDTHMWRSLTALYHPEWQNTPVSDKKYERARSEFVFRFGKLAGLAHQFLFVESLEDRPSRR